MASPCGRCGVAGCRVLHTLVLGLPWQRIGEAGVITVLEQVLQLTKLPMRERARISVLSNGYFREK